jgi:hypothetical protein
MEKVRRGADDENTRRVAEMTAEEREEEVGELKARFGSGLEDLMRRRRENREGKQVDRPVRAAQTPVTGRDLAGGNVSEDENARRVAEMSEEERKAEIQELEERFGPATLNALRARALEKQGSGSKPTHQTRKYPQPCIFFY